MYSIKLLPGRKSRIYGLFINAKTRNKGTLCRCSAGTTGIYRYSLALLSVQMTCLGVWATFARLVLTRNKVRVFSSIRFNSSWRAAEFVGNGETDISAPPLLLLKCLLQVLAQRLPL